MNKPAEPFELAAQIFDPIVMPNFEYPPNFKITVPETNATAQLRVAVPDPPPRPWRSLEDFCVPENTANPLYRGLRVLPLSWRLHFKNEPVDRGKGGIQPTELIGTAIDLGADLGIVDQLTPQIERHNEYLGQFWKWTKPESGEWANYVFCAAFAANKWRVPHEGGYMVHINFARATGDGWSYLIGGANTPPYFGPWTPLAGNLDVGEMVYFLLVHRDDRDRAQRNGLGGVI